MFTFDFGAIRQMLHQLLEHLRLDLHFDSVAPVCFGVRGSQRWQARSDPWATEPVRTGQLRHEREATPNSCRQTRPPVIHSYDASSNLFQFLFQLRL